MRLRRGDLVEVISGDERGRRGKVVKVLRKEGRVVVEGVNLVKRHRRMTRADRPGGIVEIPAPIHASNLKLLCPRCGQPARIRYRVVEGKRVRACRRCGEAIG